MPHLFRHFGFGSVNRVALVAGLLGISFFLGNLTHQGLQVSSAQAAPSAEVLVEGPTAVLSLFRSWVTSNPKSALKPQLFADLLAERLRFKTVRYVPTIGSLEPRFMSIAVMPAKSKIGIGFTTEPLSIESAGVRLRYYILTVKSGTQTIGSTSSSKIRIQNFVADTLGLDRQALSSQPFETHSLKILADEGSSLSELECHAFQSELRVDTVSESLLNQWITGLIDNANGVRASELP